MTTSDALVGESAKMQFIYKGPLFLLLGVTASFIWALWGAHGMALVAGLGVGTVVLPSGYLLSQRLAAKKRQRHLENRLVMHTRHYLQNAEPVSNTPKSVAETLARTLNGRGMSVQGFRGSHDLNPLPPVGKPVFFGPFDRQQAVESLCGGLAAEVSENLPAPVEPEGWTKPASAAIEVKSLQVYRGRRRR